MRFTSASLKARSAQRCFLAHSTAKSRGKGRLCRRWRRLLWTIRPYLTLKPYSAAFWSSANNVAWSWQISSSTNWVMYFRLSSTSTGVCEKEIKQRSSIVSEGRSIAHLHMTWCWLTPAILLYHVVWPVVGTAGDLTSSFGVRLSCCPT